MANFTADDLEDFSNTAEDIGVVSKFKDVVVSKLLQVLAAYLKTNPNATAAEMAAVVGAKESDMNALIDYHNGLNQTKEDILSAEEIRPFAPHNRQPEGFPVIFGVMTALATIVLALRLYSRIKIMGGVKLYDYIMVFGYIITTAIGIMNIVAQSVSEPFTGWYDNTINQLIAQQAEGLANMLLYPLAQIVIKSSLLLFYWQLTPWTAFRLAVVNTWVLHVLAMVAGFFTYLFSCLPIQYWTDWFGYTCPLDYVMIVVVEAAFTIITDVAIWVLPIVLVYKLRLHWKEKIGAIVTFGLGTAACIASGFRLMALKHDFNETAGQTTPSSIHIFTSLELNLTIICASAPALRALISHHAPKLLGRTRERFEEPDNNTFSKTDPFDSSSQFGNISTVTSTPIYSPTNFSRPTSSRRSSILKGRADYQRMSDYDETVDRRRISRHGAYPVKVDDRFNKPLPPIMVQRESEIFQQRMEREEFNRRTFRPFQITDQQAFDRNSTNSGSKFEYAGEAFRVKLDDIFEGGRKQHDDLV